MGLLTPGDESRWILLTNSEVAVPWGRRGLLESEFKRAPASLGNAAMESRRDLTRPHMEALIENMELHRAERPDPGPLDLNARPEEKPPGQAA